MSLVAPKGRKPLAADALFRLVRSGFATIPDPRSTAVEIACTEALRSACARCSLTSPSRLAFDTQRAADTLGTISGSERAPCDPPRRERLAPVSPASLRLVCQRVVRPWPRGKAREPMACRADHSWLCLEGTGSGAAKTLHGGSCLPTGHRNGSVPYDSQRVGAARVHPDGRAVMPWRPEPMVTQEGTDNHAGERQAAQRFLPKVRQDPPQRHGLVTADRRSAKAPPIETLHAHDRHSILGVQAGDQALGCHQGQAAEHAGRVP